MMMMGGLLWRFGYRCWVWILVHASFGFFSSSNNNMAVVVAAFASSNLRHSSRGVTSFLHSNNNNDDKNKRSCSCNNQTNLGKRERSRCSVRFAGNNHHHYHNAAWIDERYAAEEDEADTTANKIQPSTTSNDKNKDENGYYNPIAVDTWQEEDSSSSRYNQRRGEPRYRPQYRDSQGYYDDSYPYDTNVPRQSPNRPLSSLDDPLLFHNEIRRQPNHLQDGRSIPLATKDGWQGAPESPPPQRRPLPQRQPPPFMPFSPERPSPYRRNFRPSVGLDQRRPTSSSSLDMFMEDVFQDTTRRLFGSTFDKMMMFSPFVTIPPSQLLDLPSVMTPNFWDDAMTTTMKKSMQVLDDTIRLQQQQQSFITDRVLDAAQWYLNQDEACTSVLGPPIRMGRMISMQSTTASSSSSSSFDNGPRTRENMALQVVVQGSRLSGIVNIQATEYGIQQMILQVQEADGRPWRDIPVRLLARPSDTATGRATNADAEEEAEIVDAEIIPERDYRRNNIPRLSGPSDSAYI